MKIPSTEMAKNKVVQVLTRSVLAGKKRSWGQAETFFNWKSLGSSILESYMKYWKGCELIGHLIPAFSNHCCVTAAS